MTQEQVDDLLLVGHFMEIEHLFEWKERKTGDLLGVYIADDADGYFDFADSGIYWYHPNQDWNQLMKVCRKIFDIYADNRSDIFQGQRECDIDKTYKACVEFIKFWYDPKQEKHTWTNVHPENYFKRKDIFK